MHNLLPKGPELQNDILQQQQQQQQGSPSDSFTNGIRSWKLCANVTQKPKLQKQTSSSDFFFFFFLLACLQCMYIEEFKEVWREGKKPIAEWPILLSLSLNENQSAQQ